MSIVTSRKVLWRQPLQVKTGVLTQEEAEQCVSIEFNPIRAGFHGSEDIWVRDVLNLGFSPVTAVELVRMQCEH